MSEASGLDLRRHRPHETIPRPAKASLLPQPRRRAHSPRDARRLAHPPRQPPTHGVHAHTAPASYRLAWAAEFPQERLGTALEPIVARGRVFIATHHGNLYALDATSGEALWRFTSPAPFLHAPAAATDVVVAADAAGGLFALDIANGHPRWTLGLAAEPDLASAGGCSASPLLAGNLVCVGTRGGWVIARDLDTGAPRWQYRVGVPIRQTAALAGHRLIVTAEDLVVRAFDLRSGIPLWASAPPARPDRA
ncbi:MAG: PQQ-like beta-propeller repeat protein [Verrucomicrobia bacterium]|nr:PQQ-like beta-propeller repeat protein [Verrucomicrobiota bacterium]